MAEKSRKRVIAKEICQDCGKVFEGGKDAFFCPKCRNKRVEEGKKKSRERKKALAEM